MRGQISSVLLLLLIIHYYSLLSHNLFSFLCILIQIHAPSLLSLCVRAEDLNAPTRSRKAYVAEIPMWKRRRGLGAVNTRSGHADAVCVV